MTILNEEILNELSVETLVMLIQNSNKNLFKCSDIQKNLFWEALYKKTENSIYDTFQKEVIFVEWKRNKLIKEDIITILRTGWVKAVLKYDITKDNTKSCFVPFAQRLMHQEYVTCYGKRHMKDKDGVSVKEIFINNVVVNNTGDGSENLQKRCIESIEVDENSTKDYDFVEINDMLKQKMNILKNYYPKSYDMIVMYLFEEKTQNKIAEIYNTKQSCVSRNIKKGIRFLQEIISEDELYI